MPQVYCIMKAETVNYTLIIMHYELCIMNCTTGGFTMIHEIYPMKYHVEYCDYEPKSGDTVFLFDGAGVYCRIENEKVVFPKYGDFRNIGSAKLRFLFSIDDEKFYMPDISNSHTVEAPEGYELQENIIFRTNGPRYLAFAAVTAQELYQWYMQNKFCGCCGTEMAHSQTERACICPQCGFVTYPKIAPVVIVAVTNGEHLLVTRYKDRPYRRYALVAGFAEIGESLEDTVRREVLEETGIHVKNIGYYKSQPWGFTSTLLSGFFCELDGDPAITIDENELSEAIWLHRNDIPPADSDIALTAEMMEKFRLGI